MDIEKYFKQALDQNASDLHLISGNKPTLRIAGELKEIESTNLKAKELEEAVFGLMESEDVEAYKKLTKKLTTLSLKKVKGKAKSSLGGAISHKKYILDKNEYNFDLCNCIYRDTSLFKCSDIPAVY